MTHAAYEIIGAERETRWLLTCDHASNAVPAEIHGGSLGLPDEDMSRHIAYDVGAAGVTRALAQRLGATAVLGTFSRLVIDPNRGEDDPTLVMRLYDGSIIPGNRHADSDEVERRLETYHRPYHAAIARMAARRPDTVIVPIHSFTRQLRGRRPRPWHVTVLHAGEGPLAPALLAELGKHDELCVGENEPYPGHLFGDTVDRHALRTGRLNALIEIRNDLIADHEGQIAWADRLAPALERALAATDI
ncbi:MAG: N-formylglutamate amidohydrolase [Rhodobacteraceae bacterium]|nr:N-formylglutamate amidohydrolase [Paracoccaceae bacterium]